MADMAASSSTPPEDEKPVIVRVKRKAWQSPLEAFWLEINGRPFKRPLLDLEHLSLSDSSGIEELKSKKVLVQHVETTSSSEDTIDIVQSLMPKSVDGWGSKTKYEELRRTFKTEHKQNQLLCKAREKQEALSKSARFEQIWRSRKGKKEAPHDDAPHEDALHEMCHVYDVVRVDVDETTREVHEQEDADLEDNRILFSYLPLLREFIPSAAAEVEPDIHDYMSNRAAKDDYVYDLYAVKDDNTTIEEDTSNPFPLVHVDEDDEFYAGLFVSDNESDDSNAEDNSLNEYPDEETSEEDDEDGWSSSSNNESEEHDSASASKKSSEPDDSDHHSCLEDAEPLYEDYIYGSGEGDDESDAYCDEGEDRDNDYW